LPVRRNDALHLGRRAADNCWLFALLDLSNDPIAVLEAHERSRSDVAEEGVWATYLVVLVPENKLAVEGWHSDFIPSRGLCVHPRPVVRGKTGRRVVRAERGEIFGDWARDVRRKLVTIASPPPRCDGMSLVSATWASRSGGGLLLADKEPQRFGRAAIRWHGLFCREAQVDLEEAQAVLAAPRASCRRRRDCCSAGIWPAPPFVSSAFP
jgi:hypothetical protein